MVKCCSSQKVSISSCTLRLKVRALVRNRFFATCWVMVEPPCTTWPASRSVSAARPRPIRSMPGWCQNRWSSTATAAAGSQGGMSASRSGSPTTSPKVAKTSPARSSSVRLGRRNASSAASGRGRSRANHSSSAASASAPQIASMIAQRNGRSQPRRRGAGGGGGPARAGAPAGPGGAARAGHRRQGEGRGASGFQMPQ